MNLIEYIRNIIEQTISSFYSLFRKEPYNYIHLDRSVNTPIIEKDHKIKSILARIGERINKNNKVMYMIYFIGIVISIISTYQLDRILLDGGTKALIYQYIEVIIEHIKNIISGTVIDDLDVNSFIRNTKETILDSQLLINPDLIDNDVIDRIEKIMTALIDKLDSTDDNVSSCIYKFAEHYLHQCNIPEGSPYLPVSRVVRIHFLVYAYEGMLKVLKEKEVQDIVHEHSHRVFELFGSEISKVVVAIREFYSNSRI
ncbi:hypothetical protein NEOKW01_0714 [Nematocida sp. AWRm80]|nr:hypothetical protein NEOKW01_0714 [Nematocida sp. AWRm80]